MSKLRRCLLLSRPCRMPGARPWRRTATLLATLALCLLAPWAMAASPTSSHPYAHSGFQAKLLDPSVPEAQRLALFQHVTDLADQGQVRAQDLAGTLYWQGADLAGSPVDKDPQKAFTLLSNAAMQGDVTAMAKLAELRLAGGKLREAMVWAQLYAHYLAPKMPASERHGQRFAYATALIDRIQQAGGSIDETLANDVNGAVAKYNQRVRDGMRAFRSWLRAGNPRLVQMPQPEPLPAQAAQLRGVAQFMVAFDVSGKPVQVWTLASWPTGREAGLVRSWVDAARANAVADDAGVRYREVQINLNGTPAASPETGQD